MYERRLLQAGTVSTPRFMMDDRGVHAMVGRTTMCGTAIMAFDSEYGPLAEVGTTTVTCPTCLKVINRDTISDSSEVTA